MCVLSFPRFLCSLPVPIPSRPVLSSPSSRPGWLQHRFNLWVRVMLKHISARFHVGPCVHVRSRHQRHRRVGAGRGAPPGFPRFSTAMRRTHAVWHSCMPLCLCTRFSSPGCEFLYYEGSFLIGDVHCHPKHWNMRVHAWKNTSASLASGLHRLFVAQYPLLPMNNFFCPLLEKFCPFSNIWPSRGPGCPDGSSFCL